MSVQACAELVQRGDPDRFLAVMAAPVPARAALFPIYAFNLEVARAPWMSAEPMIAEMRLQWWRDALDEIAQGGPVRRHEVAAPLAEVLDAEGAAVLDRLVEARRLDIGGAGFKDAAAFEGYLADTAGALMWAAARALGAEPGEEAGLRGLGWAQGLANWFRAIPALEAAGRQPLVDGRPQAVAALARQGLARIGPRPASRAGRIAALAAWQARAELGRAAKAPALVAEGRLEASPARKRAALMLAAARI
jgi:phytoene/squalene synthetase